jgi:hypothetical protein
MKFVGHNLKIKAATMLLANCWSGGEEAER